MLSTKHHYHNQLHENAYGLKWGGPPSPRSVRDYDPVPPQKRAEPPSYTRIPKGPRRIAPHEISALRNVVNEFDLAVLLATSTATSGICDKYLDTLSAWKIETELRPVRFGARFSAIWVRHGTNIVWFCVVEDEFIAFSLNDGKHLKIEQGSDTIPQITLPRNGCRWTQIQQSLVEEFTNDDHVRAISAAVMLCTTPTGEFDNVSKQLLPAQLRQLEASLCYDSPIDEDMMTVLSDPKTTDYGDTLYFDCGAGYCAKSTVNETMGRVSRIQEPRKCAPFKESAAMLLPFVFQ